MIKIGQKIPDIKLQAYQKNQIVEINLTEAVSDKWLILAFYPADFTFVCPTELEDLSRLYQEFKKSHAEVMSVSTDTEWVHKAWHDASPSIRKIEYPMLADPAGKLSKALGTYLDDEGVSLRATFIFAPGGVLKYFSMHDLSIGRSADEILRLVQAAKYVSDNPGSVCPAGWNPGREALIPGIELVGKI